MTPETIFKVSNSIAAVGWMGLAASFFYSKARRPLVGVVVGLLSLAYTLIFLPRFLTQTGGGFSSLEGVKILFANPWVLLAGWIHYLAFDLLIGWYEVETAKRERIAFAQILPCLFATFMFGPVGFLLFQMVRLLNQRGRLNAAKAPWLVVCTVLFLTTIVALAVAWQIDGRQLLGINVWIKPLKFALSFAIFCPTFAILLQYAPLTLAQVRRYDRGLSLMVIGESVIITVQAARGLKSHFNNTSLGNELLWIAMGGMIVYLTYLVLKIGFAYWATTKIEKPEMRIAVMGSTIMFVLAAVSGVLMIVFHQHTVGAAEGGPGLPFVNWSTVGGDLRISHFIALHAIQVLPVVAFGLGLAGISNRVFWMKWATAAYATVTVTLLATALSGQPLF